MSWESRERILQEKSYDITWAPEVHERGLGIKVVEGEWVRDGDWIIYSDLDEIPRKDVIATLHGIDSERDEDRSYRSGEPEGEVEGVAAGERPVPVELCVL